MITLTLKKINMKKIYILLLGALIQGWWYVHILSLLTSMCIGTCTYYVQPHNSLYRYL